MKLVRLLTLADGETKIPEHIFNRIIDSLTNLPNHTRKYLLDIIQESIPNNTRSEAYKELVANNLLNHPEKTQNAIYTIAQRALRITHGNIVTVNPENALRPPYTSLLPKRAKF